MPLCTIVYYKCVCEWGSVRAFVCNRVYCQPIHQFEMSVAGGGWNCEQSLSEKLREGKKILGIKR